MTTNKNMKNETPKITIHPHGPFDIVARLEDGTEVARRCKDCNPAAIHQLIRDAEMVGEIDWDESTVANPNEKGSQE